MESLCKIRDICRSIAEFEEHFTKQYGISLNEGMILCSLKNSDLISSSELARLLGLTCSNTSKVLKSAEKKGFIVRVIGEKDKRQMYFSLTINGREKIESIKCKELKLPSFITI